MKGLGWLFGGASQRGKAKSLYQRGLSQAKKLDNEGAMKSYTEAIDMADAPDDVKAMAMYNRSLVYSALGEPSKAEEDLNTVLRMDKAAGRVKAEARRRLLKVQRRSEKSR